MAPGPSSNASTLDILQKTSSRSSHRLYPSEMESLSLDDGHRLPSRAVKASRRESRLGLRSLFARNKSSLHDVRASVADLSSWPYAFHAARSEIVLTPDSPEQRQSVSAAGLPTSVRRPSYNKQLPASPNSRSRKSSLAPSRTETPSPPRSSRGALAAWDPPPLFQAYPQAIKHIQLPACTTSVETLMRLQNSHSGVSSSSASIRTARTSIADSTEDGSVIDRSFDKPKKRHRRNTSASSMRLDWVNKIYVFVTSGYLLQYAGEGSFDRLPEKMLHITKDSAAFASDLIPGRHWVLQVCSAMDPAGSNVPESRSLFSRLSFRGNERRHASTFLMVFEDADDMENWITTLRREIEHLGGKKHLSETGKPKADDDGLELKGQPSQRTLVVRDQRFSHFINPQDADGPTLWRRDSVMSTDPRAPDILLQTPADLDLAQERDHSADDMSVSNSMISHDGHQLDNLRESSNRLSFISSGQRTIMTSEYSSPPCSPLRQSFSNNNSEEAQPPAESPKEVRPRPNAAAIINRRQSQQLSSHNPLLDFRFPEQAGQPLSPPPNQPLPQPPADAVAAKAAQGLGLRASPMPPPSMPPPSIPNFSVPHKAPRRFSVGKGPGVDLAAPAARSASPAKSVSTTSETSSRKAPVSMFGGRRAPPPALTFSRPLSSIADRPSPAIGTPALSNGASHATSSVCSNGPDTPALLLPMDELSAQHLEKHGAPAEGLFSRRSIDASSMERAEAAPMPVVATGFQGRLRSKSSLDFYGRPRSRSRSPLAKRAMKSGNYKRATMFGQPSEVLPQSLEPFPAMSDFLSKDTSSNSFAAIRRRLLADKREPRGPRPSVSNVHLRATSNSHKSHPSRRRSMSQLAEGPPPAPPPTCALPPLPPKNGSKSVHV